jgi:hypothetical protein
MTTEQIQLIAAVASLLVGAINLLPPSSRYGAFLQGAVLDIRKVIGAIKGGK